MTREGYLCLSTNRGRYAIGDANGVDIRAGDYLETFLGGQWIGGTIQHDSDRYANNHPVHRAIEGYYFWADDETVCGLCVGMQVRIVEG